MVLVYLKNLIFPSQSTNSKQHNKSRHSDDLESCVRTSRSFSSSSLSTSIESHEKLLSHSPVNSSDGQSPPSSVSGDTIVEPTPRRSFLVDPRVISDATIGLSDGLTVPFALTAGLSALGDTRIVIFGGLAELTAGAISMGMGGYLAARSEADAYNTALITTQQLVKTSPASAATLVRTTLSPYFPYHRQPATAVSPLDSVTDHLTRHPDHLVDFLMRFHHSLAAPSDTRGAWTSALTIAASYFLGGFVPLMPYFVAGTVGAAFLWSVGLMVVALFVFGAGKTWLTSVSGCGEDGFGGGEEVEVDGGDSRGLEKGGKGRVGSKSTEIVWKCFGGGIQMVVLGGLAACASVGLVTLFN